MGQPVKILELAEDMIRLSGFTPYEEIDIEFSGIRKGEKLFEELELSGEGLENTRHPKIFIGTIGTYESNRVEDIFGQFRSAVANNDEALVRSLFNSTLAEANIAETIDIPSSAITLEKPNARAATTALPNVS
jgi:FlaA1/EpsC-like NDP-sugar epimerase